MILTSTRLRRRPSNSLWKICSHGPKAGKVKIEKRDVDIHSVLSETIAMVQSEIGQKKIALTQKLSSTQGIVSGDTTRLQQILWNVLKNAIKFTPPEGTITLESSVEHGHYIVRVSDNGIGMTPQELTCAFDAFKQGEHSEDARRFGGLGLGLAISKKFVELHSGTIEASSEGRNRGSTFTIKFPLAKWDKNSVDGDHQLLNLQNKQHDRLHTFY
jgi:signal transduction histidine kinase